MAEDCGTVDRHAYRDMVFSEMKPTYAKWFMENIEEDLEVLQARCEYFLAMNEPMKALPFAEILNEEVPKLKGSLVMNEFIEIIATTYLSCGLFEKAVLFLHDSFVKNGNVNSSLYQNSNIWKLLSFACFKILSSASESSLFNQSFLIHHWLYSWKQTIRLIYSFHLQTFHDQLLSLGFKVSASFLKKISEICLDRRSDFSNTNAPKAAKSIFPLPLCCENLQSFTDEELQSNLEAWLTELVDNLNREDKEDSLNSARNL